MLAENPVQSLPEYARDAQPGYKIPPTQTQISNGVIPLDSLPAQWWNTLWGDITKQERNTVTALNTIITEVNNVLQEYGVTPSESSTTQLNLAIKNAFDSFKDAVVGTMTDLETTVKDTVVGAINSLFTERGLLTDLTTADKNTVVGAINEVDSDLDTHIADTNNPHRVTKAQVGLSDVVNKPMDSEVTEDSENYISSGAVAAAITSAGAVPLPATATPLGASSTGTVGTSNTYARGDHRHPFPVRADVSRYTYILGNGTAAGRMAAISWYVGYVTGGRTYTKNFSYFTADGTTTSATLTLSSESTPGGGDYYYLRCNQTALLVTVTTGDTLGPLVVATGVSANIGHIGSSYPTITILAAL